MISLLPLETCHIRAGREGPGYRGGVSVKARARRELARVPGALALARLTVETIRVCLRYRVTGLASEAGFFMLLSLPPLLLGLFGGVGYLGQWLGQDTVNQILGEVQGWAEEFLTEDLIADTLLPTVQDVLETGRFDLISVGFCCRSGPARARSTSSSTRSRSCTGSPGSGASSAPGRSP